MVVGGVKLPIVRSGGLKVVVRVVKERRLDCQGVVR